MTDNEKLIEEARNRSVERARQNPEGSVDLALRLADALEAAEKAHIPTDDELDAVAEIIDEHGQMVKSDYCQCGATWSSQHLAAAVEPGTRETEKRRHDQFSRSLAQGREWFAESDALTQHIADLATRYAAPANAMHRFSTHEGIKHV